MIVEATPSTVHAAVRMKRGNREKRCRKAYLDPEELRKSMTDLLKECIAEKQEQQDQCKDWADASPQLTAYQMLLDSDTFGTNQMAVTKLCIENRIDNQEKLGESDAIGSVSG
ncbi:hypothetical protein H8959_016441 [Pygathrix nigripes]